MPIASRSPFQGGAETYRYAVLIFLLFLGIKVEGFSTYDPNDGVLWNATYGIDVNESISQARFYHVRLPLSYPLDDASSSSLMPLVIQLHGGGGNASNFEQTTRLGEAAVARGYIVVFGEGIDNKPPNGVRTWNAGRRPALPVELLLPPRPPPLSCSLPLPLPTSHTPFRCME